MVFRCYTINHLSFHSFSFFFSFSPLIGKFQCLGCHQPVHAEPQARISKDLLPPKNANQGSKRPPSHQMYRQQHKDNRMTKKQRNTALLKDIKKPLETGEDEEEIYEMTDKQFRIVLLQKFRELQENTDKKLSEIREIIHQQHEMFDREIKVNHFKIKILEMKNRINELANSTTGFDRRLDKAEGRISELEDWAYDSRL